jgi:hypothetical protein
MTPTGGDSTDKSETNQLGVVQGELADIKAKVIEISNSLKPVQKATIYKQIGNVGFGGMCAGMGLAAGSRFISEGVAIFLLAVALHIVSLFPPSGK